MADDVEQNLIYGSTATKIDFSQLSATAAGPVSQDGSINVTKGANTIPGYLEGVNSNQ